MKKVFLLALALCSTVVQTNATDMGANCSQQGFQVGIGLGYGLTTPTNTTYDFVGPEDTTPGKIQANLQDIVDPENFSVNEPPFNPYDIAGLGLDYSNVSTWSSQSALLGSFNIGYKTFFDCNKYSVTGTAFIMFNGASMTSNLMAESTNFQVNVDQKGEEEEGYQTNLNGSIGSGLTYAGKLKLTSGPVFGFNVLLAKEFSWGNAGLLLGMKFNSYRLSYLQTNADIISDDGVVTLPGYIDITGTNNDNTSVNIQNYLYRKSKTRTATGFTFGFATNYYISDNLSAGLTVFYDMYTPISFNLQNIEICPYVPEGGEQVKDSGKIKFQNNTIGVMMNLTYSFGAN
ncbi:MAG: hypothetical protein FJX00_00990 [Alphaproteobacteria bacterium]|nr:hypothetical protein [Alphaproteobacteria bacterium]